MATGHRAPKGGYPGLETTLGGHVVSVVRQFGSLSLTIRDDGFKEQARLELAPEEVEQLREMLSQEPL